MELNEIEIVARLFSDGKSYKEIASELGMSVDQVKRRYYASRDKKIGSQSQAYQLGGDAKDRKILLLSDENARLRKEIKDQHRENIDAEYINSILGTLISGRKESPPWLVNISSKKKNNEVLMTSWADWHGGEVVHASSVNGINEYNLKIMEKRVKTLIDKTIDLARNHGPGNYPGVVINLIGDMVSGGLHEELRKTDEAPPLTCALKVIELLTSALRTMADEFGNVYVPCVCGNHGRMTAKPEFKQYVQKNWDYLIYKMLEREFVNDKRIVIDVRESNEVYYNVYGTTYLAVHGDMLSKGGTDSMIGSLGPLTRGEIKTRGRMDTSGMPYDVLLCGHYHQSFWLPRLICAGTLKGWCEYAKNQLNAPPLPPTQPLWFHHPKYGITSRWEIRVDEVKEVKDKQWVSVFDPAKKIVA